METAPLKSFATASRTELIREVGARITAVLAVGSPERVEQPMAVTALERAIAGAGGGDKGRAHVADKVAYTWFNRVIALRFMDANGYTGMGVVSPAPDQVGQPEVLAAAKRGQVDIEVVRGTNAATVTGLLNGTRQPRPGVDAQAEAYELLLADYCRFWNAAMPFMFEREGDYTELLIPANLLADDSFLSRSVTVLTEDVCQDVEVIGWLYQFYISERKDEVFAGFKKNKKAGADEIPAATQLFTPHWIVRYLVENSLGRLWMLNRPASGLASRMDYYIAPVDEETDFLQISTPEELKVIDPACGSGHMLTYAFDLLYAIYEEEGYAPSEIPSLILANNLFGTEIDPRAGALAAFALAMKASARRKLFLKNPVEPNICVLEPISFSPDELDYLVTRDGDRYAEEAFWNQFAQADTLGSLITPDPGLTVRLTHHLATVDHEGDMFRAGAVRWAARVVRQASYLTTRYAVSVANPPYMGAKNMTPALAEFAQANFRFSKSDLFAMFIERCRALVSPHGLVAMITMQSWMFLKSFVALRKDLLNNSHISSMVHLGTGAFGSISGEVVSTTAWVMQAGGGRRATKFVRVVDVRGDAKREEVARITSGESVARVFEVKQGSLLQVPGAPVAYWLGQHVIKAFAEAPSVGSQFDIRVGMQTSNNAKYLRYWWEPSSSALDDEHDGAPRWIPYAKGGPFRRWTGNLDSVLHYKFDPSYILQQSNATVLPLATLAVKKVSWTHMSPGDVSFRILPERTFHDIGGHAIYSGSDDSCWLLGYLNSRFVGSLVQALNPTVNIQTSDIARIPLLSIDREALNALASEAIKISGEDDRSQETHSGFLALPLLNQPAPLIADGAATAFVLWERRAARIQQIEDEVEVCVASAAGVEPIAIPGQVVLFNSAIDRADWDQSQVMQLVSYAIGCMFGRYSLDEPGLLLADQGATLQDYLAKVPSPTFMPDADNVIPIVDGDWFEDDIVGRFRQFLRVAFGEQYFEENLKYVTESLGVRDLRDYFISRAGRSKFYADHVQRYKKRPIYWLFSSPKGSFNALIYMHRYTPSTVSTVLTYLREYVTKLESALQQAERAGNAKEADRLRKILVELNEYEHDTLYPKASENVVIDLDDGVKANYPKFGTALRRITGLEASGD
jgi:hypothetical protein